MSDRKDKETDTNRPKSKAWYIRQHVRSTDMSAKEIAEVCKSDVSNVYRVKRALGNPARTDEISELRTLMMEMAESIRGLQVAYAGLIAERALERRSRPNCKVTNIAAYRREPRG